MPPTTYTRRSALSANPPFELISYYMNVLYCKNRRRRFLLKLILRGFAAYHKVRTLRKNACGVFAQVNFLPLTPHTIKSALSANPPFELISYYMNVLYCKNRRRRFLLKLILHGFAAYHKVRTLRKNAVGVFAQVNFARQRRTKFTCSRIPPYTTFPPDAKQSTQARCPPARPRRQNAR